MSEEILYRGLKELGLPGDGSLLESLAQYTRAIESWNPAYGLVGASGDELVIKHILDSLAPLSTIESFLHPRVDEPLHIVDLGTGAGLPGIPLALARPHFRITLLDRMTRRIRFLEAMKSELHLDTVDIVEEQVERAKGSFDVVTFRAFRPFERKLFKRVFSICAPGGIVVAYKGKAEKARAELPKLEGLYASVTLLPVKVPFLDDERCIVVMTPFRKPA